jgi:hypothetical protein
MLNRKRFWFFTVVLALAFVLGAATLSAVLAGPPSPTAQDKPPRDQPGRERGPQGQRDSGERRQRPTGAPEQPGSGPERRGPAGTGAVPAAADRRAGVDAPPGPASPYPRPEGRPPDRGGGAEPHPGGGPAAQDGAATRPDAGVAGGEPPADGAQDDRYFANCTHARRAGAAPLYRGEPGYRDKLDKDGDGTACD